MSFDGDVVWKYQAANDKILRFYVDLTDKKPILMADLALKLIGIFVGIWGK